MRRRSRVAALVAVTAVALTACGGDGGGSTSPTEPTGTGTGTGTGTDELITVRATSLPLLDNGPYFYALRNGIFEEHGIEVEDITSAGGALGIPAMIGGEVDLVFSNTISVLLAASEGLPVRIVAATNENIPEGAGDEDFVAIVAGPDSGVSSPADLAGKRMSVNTLNNINWLYTRAWLREQGVDPDSVELVELPFPEQVPAVLENQVAATMIGAPFRQQLVDAGASELGFPYRVSERVLVANYVTSQAYADANPEVVTAFRAAMAQANAEVSDPANRDAVLTLFEEITRIPRDILEQVTFPVFVADPDPAVIQSMGELMVAEGLLSAIPEIAPLILAP